MIMKKNNGNLTKTHKITTIHYTLIKMYKKLTLTKKNNLLNLQFIKTYNLLN